MLALEFSYRIVYFPPDGVRNFTSHDSTLSAKQLEGKHSGRCKPRTQQALVGNLNVLCCNHPSRNCFLKLNALTLFVRASNCLNLVFFQIGVKLIDY